MVIIDDLAICSAYVHNYIHILVSIMCIGSIFLNSDKIKNKYKLKEKLISIINLGIHN